MIVDQSRFERINGRWFKRPMPRELHAQVQLNFCLELRQLASQLGGKTLQEWSITQPETASEDEPNYLTPDVAFAFSPYQTTVRGHLLQPVFLAVEVASPDQEGLISKAQTYYSWGVSHVWIIYPHSRECVEYHGGNQFTIAASKLTAGPLTVFTDAVFGWFRVNLNRWISANRAHA